MAAKQASHVPLEAFCKHANHSVHPLKLTLAQQSLIGQLLLRNLDTATCCAWKNHELTIDKVDLSREGALSVLLLL